MPELSDPPPQAWQPVLRRAVFDHALGEHRQRHPALLHVGRPGATEVVVAAHLHGTDTDVGSPGGVRAGSDAGPADDPGGGDLALRVDVVAALLRRVSRATGEAGPAPLVWLTRAGALDLQDVDVAWLTAAATACAEAEADLTMVVVNRHGWRDPRSGASRHWRRIRRR